MSETPCWHRKQDEPPKKKPRQCLVRNTLATINLFLARFYPAWDILLLFFSASCSFLFHWFQKKYFFFFHCLVRKGPKKEVSNWFDKILNFYFCFVFHCSTFFFFFWWFLQIQVKSKRTVICKKSNKKKTQMTIQHNDPTVCKRGFIYFHFNHPWKLEIKKRNLKWIFIYCYQIFYLF